MLIRSIYPRVLHSEIFWVDAVPLLGNAPDDLFFMHTNNRLHTSIPTYVKIVSKAFQSSLCGKSNFIKNVYIE